jgi:hypothetical protein
VATQVDKLVVTNQTALTAKYDANGFRRVQDALGALIAADKVKGLTTQILFIDNGTDMAAVGGSPVGGPDDERSAKAAVDAAFSTLRPDYILLLDGPDVVPHIKLDAIAGLEDGDATIPSDLPYASAGAWGRSRDASQFLAVTRVVGRLPAAEGTRETAPILAAIESSCAHTPKPASAYTPPFAISAGVWQASTQTSVNAVFGPGTALNVSPQASHPTINPMLPRLMHFINCHGATAIDEFYGQMGAIYPVAMKSESVEPHIAEGTVVTAECCFGAELYDFNALGIAPPICMAYFQRGAAAFVGSTTIAYGPAVGNAQADLLTQYFLNHVLAGASTGRAMLQARQDFIRTQLMSNPTNLKTIAQFLLLGDPSCQPCQSTDPAAQNDSQVTVATSTTEGSPELARKAIRVALDAAGHAAAATATRPGRRRAPLPQPVMEQVQQLAQRRALATDRITVLKVTGGATYRAVSKALDGERKVAVVVDRNAKSEVRPQPFIRVLVAHILNDRIVRVEETERR